MMLSPASMRTSRTCFDPSNESSSAFCALEPPSLGMASVMLSSDELWEIMSTSMSSSVSIWSTFAASLGVPTMLAPLTVMRSTSSMFVIALTTSPSLTLTSLTMSEPWALRVGEALDPERQLELAGRTPAPSDG